MKLVIDPLWLEWVRSNLMRSCNPLEMVELMHESGQWSYADAAKVIDTQLADLNMPIQWRLKQPHISMQNVIRIDDRDISVTARTLDPEVVLIENVLSNEECDQLIDMAFKKGLSRSYVIAGPGGSSIPHNARTSTSIFFKISENSFIRSIEERLSRLTNWPHMNGEGLQVICYQDRQQYTPHFDWFTPDNPAMQKYLQYGGQRVSTTIVYLKRPELGGATIFPKIDLELIPSKGGAVFFKNVTPTGVPDKNAYHGGQSVNEGVKIVAVYWQRESEYVLNTKADNP